MAEPSPHDDAALTTHTSVRRRHSAVGLGADAALVVLFAVVGNRSHTSGLSAAEVWSTAWPFLMGLALGWLLTVSWRHPSSIWPGGVVVVIVTVACGMMMRQLFTDGGVQLSFVVVATLTLAVFMLGRRLMTRLLFRRR